MTQQQYEIGQWVRSIPVGKAPAFNGEIIEHGIGGYTVRDADKVRGFRLREELEPLQ